MKINLLCIATRKYKTFVPQFLEGVKKYFFVNHEVELNLFTDELEHEYLGDERVKVNKELIPSYTFPNATLLRYKIFTSKEYTCDYLLYSDIDMKIVDYIDESILGNIIAVKHPGFSKVVSGGSWETNKKSTSYVYPENRIYYWAGGVQGGANEYYYRAMQRMKRDIEEDERNGIIPIWHDESAWNCFLSERCGNFKQLGSEYCCPEPVHLRRLWGIDDIPPKIIALAKDHASIRS